MQIGGHNKKGKEEYRYDGSHVVSFERIGVIPILVFLGYLSSASLLIGGLIIVIVKDGFFDLHTNHVLFISDGLKSFPGVSILFFSTAYAFLWGATLFLSWTLKDISVFVLACINIIMFNGVVAYVEFNGKEHFVFVVGLAVTHIMIQDRVAHSKLGSALYRGVSLFGTICTVCFLVLYVLGVYMLKSTGVEFAAFVFELIVWVVASVEYFFLVGTLQMCEDTDWAHHKQNGRNIFPPPNYHINANSNNAQYGMYVPLMQRANSVYEKSTREGANNTQLASF